MRLTFILTIIVGATEVWAQAPVRCEFERPVELRLDAHEFSMPAYDAQRGLLVIQLRRELLPNFHRPSTVHLNMRNSEIILPIMPASVSLGLERGARHLQLVVEAEPMQQDAASLETRPDCHELRLKALRLENDSLVLTRHTVVDETDKSDPRVEIKQGFRVTDGELDAQALKSVINELAQVCLRKSLIGQSTIQGALSIRLARSLVGQPEKPTIVVDGLVNRQIGYCLTASLVESKNVWSAIEPGTVLFLDLYLRAQAQGHPPTVHVEAERRFR